MSSPASNGLKTRVRLDLQQKIEILNFIANGKKQIDASKQFNVPRGTLALTPVPMYELEKHVTAESSVNLYCSVPLKSVTQL